jgi:hypothetical protein
MLITLNDLNTSVFNGFRGFCTLFCLQSLIYYLFTAIGKSIQAQNPVHIPKACHLNPHTAAEEVIKPRIIIKVRKITRCFMISCF